MNRVKDSLGVKRIRCLIRLVLTLFVLSILLHNAAGSVYYSMVMQPYATVTMPPVILQAGTAGTSTIYTNKTSAKVNVTAPVPIYDFVDNNTSDVDSSPDKGTHSNFTAQQYGPDSIYDILTEQNTGGQSSTITLRPNAAGTYQQWSTFGSGSNHWDRTSDQNDATGVQVTGSTTLKETENLADTTQTGTINSVTAYMRAKESGETLVYNTITFDAAYSTILTATGTSMSWSHTTGTGTNRILLVDIGIFSATTPATVTSITYGGVALTLVATSAYLTAPMVRGYLYRLVNPATGTNTISVSFSASTLAVGGSATYFNVDQTNPIQVSGSNTGSGTAQSVSLTPTGTYSKLFYANMMSYRTAAPTAYTVTEGAGQTNRWAQIGSTHKGRGSDKSVTDGTLQTMSWSTSRAASWVSIGAIVVPSQSNPVEQAVILWRTYSSDYESSAITISRTDFTDYSEARTTNPNTGSDWTWDEVNTLEIGSRASTLGSSETIQVSEYWIVVDYTTPPNYELDLEVQWTNVDFNETNEELCIYGGTMGSENIRVDVWNSSGWKNLFTDLNSGWNNFSVSSYLTSSTFTIRFKGDTETGDTNQDSWNIDATLLHVWTTETYDYVLKVVNKVAGNWTVNLQVYDSYNIDRLSSLNISLHDGTSSNQIAVSGGSIIKSEGEPYNLAGNATIYISMSNIQASSAGTTRLYVYLKILTPNTSTYALYIITFEIT